MHDSISDPKYGGVKTSRQQFHASDDENEDENEESTDHSESKNHWEEVTRSMRGDLSSSEDEEGDFPIPSGAKSTMDSEVSTRYQDQDIASPSRQNEPLESTLQRTRVADKLKGKAVSRQLVCL